MTSACWPRGLASLEGALILLFGLEIEGEADGEGGATAWLAFGLDGTMMEFNDALGHGETEAKSVGGELAAGGVGAIEALEDVGEVVFTDADAGIGDRDKG